MWRIATAVRERENGDTETIRHGTRDVGRHRFLERESDRVAFALVFATTPHNLVVKHGEYDFDRHYKTPSLRHAW